MFLLFTKQFLRIKKDINWKLVINEAIIARENNSWILLDLEEKLKELRNKFFIKKEIFDMIYEAEKRFH